MSGRLFFFITLKVGADNCRNQPIHFRSRNSHRLGIRSVKAIYDMKSGHQQTGRRITVAQSYYRGHLCGQG